MRADKELFCECISKYENYKDYNDYFNKNFNPNGWMLSYEGLKKVEEDRYLYLVGKCPECKKLMCITILFSPERVGLDFITRIWEVFIETDHCSSDNKHGVAWLKEQEKKSVQEKLDIFVSLFDDKDKGLIDKWLDLNKDNLIFKEGFAKSISEYNPEVLSQAADEDLNLIKHIQDNNEVMLKEINQLYRRIDDLTDENKKLKEKLEKIKSIAETTHI